LTNFITMLYRVQG